MATDEQLPGVFNIIFWAGDGYSFSTYVMDEDPDSPDPDEPDLIRRPLDGFTVRAQVRENAKASAVLATFTTEIVDDEVFVELEKDQSELLRALSGKKGSWDLELTDPTGVPETILAGFILAKLDTTRD